MKTYKRSLCIAALPFILTLSAFAQAPSIASGGTGNAADYSRDFASGAIIAIFGSNLASITGGAVSLPLPTSLGGASVSITSGGNTQNLPLFYVSPKQINAQLPYGITGAATLTVTTSAGTSAPDAINIVPRAPKLFTVNFSGKGAAVATDTGFNILTSGIPAKPGDDIVLFMNGLGATNPPVIAGNAAPGGPFTAPATIPDTLSVTIGGKPATVTFAGLAPGYSGLYQVNVKAPFLVVTGPMDVQITVNGVSTQSAATVAYRQLGYYYAMVGGKPVTGQTVNGANALAYRQNDELTWGAAGYNQWIHPVSSQLDSAVAGEAVTFKNGSTTVYDNNGIDAGAAGNFYNNAGGGSDSTKPGLTNLYSMSNYFPLVMSSYVRLTAPVTVTEMIGYFDGNGSPELPFDPMNQYIKYRMNLRSNASGLPTDTGTYTGNVFSTDSTAGTFTVASTGVTRVSSIANAAPDPIWRVSFKPNSPVTIPAGEYWFSHDASIRATPASSSTAASFITTSELMEIIRMQPEASKGGRFSFFGRQMQYQGSYELPFAVQVRPDSPVSVMR